MTTKEILAELQKNGTDTIKKIFLKHGAREPVYGVKVEDLKKLIKRLKLDHRHALELYDTGVSDAIYLAGLIGDGARMSRAELQHWVEAASWHMISGTVVPGVAAESPHGHDLALGWIDSPKEQVAVAGWSTLSLLVATKPDAELDLAELKSLLKRVEQTIHTQPNRVRYAMNGFVISTGCHVRELTATAKATAKSIGKVSVDMGDTSCKVPDAADYIRKVEQRGSLGRKRASTKC